MEKKNTPTLGGYTTGYLLSLLLTLAIFGLTYLHIRSDHTFITHPVMHASITALAIVQLFVQTIFFLHLSVRKEENSKLMAYIFTLYTVAFIVIGSLWIIGNLNTNMSPEQVAKYMNNED